MIETDRLALRPLTPADVEEFVALHGDPRVSRFVGSYSRPEALERLAAIERQWTDRGHGIFAIELKSTGEFIGRSGLLYWEQFDEIELSWTLRAEHWGRGYATEAAQACLDWGFRNLALDYVIAMIRPGNDASVRVAERLGFTVRREDTLWDKPITVYALDRLPPAADFAGRAGVNS